MPRDNSSRSIAGRVARIGAAVLIAIGAVYAWPRLRTQRVVAIEPPAIQLEDVDPAVARVIQSARTAVQQAPRSGAAWGKLGMLFLAHDLPAQANSSFARAEVLEPREPRWPYYQAISLTSGDPDAAIPKLRRAVELCGKSRLEPVLRLAELLLQNGQLDEAEKFFRGALGEEAYHSVAALGLARVYFAQGKPQEALAEVRRAAPNLSTAKGSYQLLAQVYAKIGNQAEAVTAARQASRLTEDGVWPDRFAEEIARLATGKQARIVRADQLLGQHRVGDAIAALREIVHDYPDADWAWMLLGRAYLENGDVAGGERALWTAVQWAPDSVLIQYHLGIVALMKMEYGAAAACFRKAIQLQPDFALAYGDLGTCLQLQGDRAGAEAAFRTALRCKPDYPQAHAGLGELLVAEHRQSEAAAHLRRAVELDPSDTRASKLLERIEAADIGAFSDKK